MQVAICGLGRMGAGMARRAARGGHEVVAWNRTEAVATEIAGEAENEGRIAVAEPIERLAEMMAAPRHVVISVPSGDATDAMVAQLAGILEPGDVIIDAGNSRFHDSRRHAAELAEQGIEWLDMGVSGGVWGLTVGFCAMLGGKREVFDRFEPVVKTLAPGERLPVLRRGRRRATTPRWSTTGSSTESCRPTARASTSCTRPTTTSTWPPSPACGTTDRSFAPGCSSWPAMRSRRRATTSREVHGWVADSGEGRWTVAEAIDHDVPAPIITLSLIERFRSRREPDSYTDRVLAALRNEFGGHAIKDRG